MTMKQKKGNKGFLHTLTVVLKHIFFHNGWLKLLALVISVLLWAGLISQDKNITREKVFTDVNVNITGQDSIKRSGFIVVSDLDEALSGITMTAAVPQQQFDSAEASAYNARVDLTKITGTGAQELKLQTTNSASFGKVVSMEPESITVEVEEYAIRQRIPVSFSMPEDIPEGWYISTPTVDPNLITVSGPKSLVQTISRARVFVKASDLEWKEGQSITSVPFVLYNSSGDEVESDLLEVTSNDTAIDSVIIVATILPKKTFDVKGQIQVTGNPARGYQITGVHVSPESVTVAARSEVLDQLDEPLMEKTVNVRNLKETTVFQLKIQKPSDDAVVSNETVTVTVDIEAIEP